MRLEVLVAEALKRVDNDRYLLAKAIGKRANELSGGSAPLVDMDIKKSKATDIALCEIAEGKLRVSINN